MTTNQSVLTHITATPAQTKQELATFFGITVFEIAGILDELTAAGAIYRYTDRGRQVYAVTGGGQAA